MGPVTDTRCPCQWQEPDKPDHSRTWLPPLLSCHFQKEQSFPGFFLGLLACLSVELTAPDTISSPNLQPTRHVEQTESSDKLRDSDFDKQGDRQKTNLGVMCSRPPIHCPSVSPQEVRFPANAPNVRLKGVLTYPRDPLSGPHGDGNQCKKQEDFYLLSRMCWGPPCTWRQNDHDTRILIWEKSNYFIAPDSCIPKYQSCVPQMTLLLCLSAPPSVFYSLHFTPSPSSPSQHFFVLYMEEIWVFLVGHVGKEIKRYTVAREVLFFHGFIM